MTVTDYMSSRRTLVAAVAVPALIGAFLLTTSVSQPLSGVNLYNGKRLLQLVLLAVLGVLPLMSMDLQRETGRVLCGIPRAVWFALAGFFALGLASALRLQHPAYALAEVGLFATWIILVLLVAGAALLNTKWFERVALLGFSLVGFGVFLQEMAGLAAYTSLGEEFQYREALIRFVHPRYYNQLQTWTLPLLALLPVVFSERHRAMWVAAALLISFQWYLLLMTGARGSIAALALAFGLFALSTPRMVRHWAPVHGLGLLLGLLIYAAAAWAVTEAGKGGDGAFLGQSVGRPVMHTTGRTLLWWESAKDIDAHPWLGSGPMHYACDGPGWVAAHPHNFALQVAGEWGLPAAALLGLTIAWLLWRSWKLAHRAARGSKADSEKPLQVTLLAASMFAAAAHLQVSGLLVSPASQVTGALVAGWLLALGIRSFGLAAGPSIVWGRTLAIALLVMGLVLTGFARSELPGLNARTVYVYEDLAPAAPRFWSDGRACRYRWETPTS